MNWLRNLFGRKKRQARYVLNVNMDIPENDLARILRSHTPIIGARDMNKLPADLQRYFVRAGK